MTNRIYLCVFLPAVLCLALLPLGRGYAQDAGVPAQPAAQPAAPPATTAVASPPATIAPEFQDVSTYRNGYDHAGSYDTNLSPKLAVAWQTTNEGSTNNISSPVIHDGILYFGAGKHVWALSADDGHVIWSYPKQDDFQTRVQAMILVIRTLALSTARPRMITARYILATTTTSSTCWMPKQVTTSGNLRQKVA